MNSDELISSRPADARDVARVLCVRAGTVPVLERGQSVWVINGPFWMTATVGARLPGNVYRGQIDGMGRREGYVIISANIFGGLVE